MALRALTAIPAGSVPTFNAGFWGIRPQNATYQAASDMLGTVRISVGSDRST
ncbi:hypothetical protein SAMN06265370_1175 [Puniceibacterium sediminis]|uniref:Uncharacterized protein n=1 Tax=Puniceibacterium sediminis TaxID=1608407 RepID=A0A238YIG8_9RHOB|nr:hypothetical protein SAMN06265370_1175 [Puniceibacterium sediminis]